MMRCVCHSASQVLSTCHAWFDFQLPEWGEAGEAYSLSNEGRTATRTGDGLTCMLYSHGNTYTAGDTLILRILDSADVSPGDGLAIVYDKQDEESCNRSGAIFINTYGELEMLVLLDSNVTERLCSLSELISRTVGRLLEVLWHQLILKNYLV